MLLGYIVSIQLTRLLTPTDFGVWSYIFQSVIPIGLVLVLYGNPHFLVRELVQLLAKKELKTAKKLLKESVLLSSIVFLIVGLIMFLSGDLIFGGSGLGWLGTIIVIVVTGLLAVGRIRQSFQQVIAQSGISQIPERVVLPTLFLVSLFVLGTYMGQVFELELVLQVYVVCVAIAVGVGFTVLKPLQTVVSDQIVGKGQQPKTRKTRKYFFLLSVVDIIDTNIDLILLKYLVGFEEIAFFSIAKRISFLLNLILYSTNYTLFPIASSWLTEGRREELQQRIFKVVKINTLIATLGVIVLLVLKGWILNFFGERYATEIGFALYGTLLLIQWVNVILGLPGLLLNISGNERYSLVVFTVAIILQIVLSIWLVPLYGIIAMALVHLINTLFWNVSLGMIAKRKTGLRATFLY